MRPTQQRNELYTKKREFRKEEGLLYNRLCSIVEDSNFVTDTASLFPGYPLVANLRCGLWYSPLFDATCYFKSTDGHTHHWTFSNNRLNLHIALLASIHGGCLIIDSTRKGKKFPDSFSRTIPIWCATVNRAIAVLRANNNITIFNNNNNNNKNSIDNNDNNNNNNNNDSNNSNNHNNDNLIDNNTTCNNSKLKTNNDNNNDNQEDSDNEREEREEEEEEEEKEEEEEDNNTCSWDTELHVPPWVSKTEKLQMESLVDKFVTNLLESGADLSELAATLQKPLRCIWVSPASLLIRNMMPDRTKLSFSSIICLSASRVQDVTYFADLQTSAYRYVQGAGDDEEGWARGLKPDMFWKNQSYILEEGPSGIEERVMSVVKEIENSMGECATLRNVPSATIPYTVLGNTGLAVSISIESTNWEAILQPPTALVNCSPLPYKLQNSSVLTDGPFYKYFPVRQKKAGKNALGAALQEAVPYVITQLTKSRGPNAEADQITSDKNRPFVIVHSYESVEIPVCICIAVLAKLFDYEGELLPTPRTVITKEDVSRIYLLVDKFIPQSLPQRTMRNVINDYLMGPPANMREPPTKRKQQNNETE